MYVSYARNAEEEEFVLLTLRGVLENEFGYKLCIFDRDSLPGGSEYRTGGCAPCTSSLYCSLRYRSLIAASLSRLSFGFLLINSLWRLLMFLFHMTVMLHATEMAAVGMVVGCFSCSFQE